MAHDLPGLYTDLSDWYLLLTAPEDYEEEAAFYLKLMTETLAHTPRSLLELGAGSGNNAWHYKSAVADVTLTDLAPRMLALSEAQNPECEHVVGDMRSLRLGREYEAVFVHDAISYLTTESDLGQAIETAFVHCQTGGAALFAPDAVRENYRDETEHGGHDGVDGRSLRYLQWTFDPDPADSTYVTEFAYIMHQSFQPSRVAHEQHVTGLFAEADWLRLMSDVGFSACAVPFQHSEVERPLVVFVGRKGDVSQTS
ncbi:MAG: class I SAM-dependent methyltransferase [Chloroflexota bacterium]